jgi:hypothetical protein
MMMGASAAFPPDLLLELLTHVLHKTQSEAATVNSVAEPLAQTALYIVFLMKGCAAAAALARGARAQDEVGERQQYLEVLRQLLASLLRDSCELESNSSPCFRGCMYAALTHHLQQIHVVAAMVGEEPTLRRQHGRGGGHAAQVANALNARSEQLLQLLATDASTTGGSNGEVRK